MRSEDGLKGKAACLFARHVLGVIEIRYREVTPSDCPTQKLYIFRKFS